MAPTFQQVAVIGDKIALSVRESDGNTAVQPLYVQTGVEFAVNVERDGSHDDGGETAGCVHLRNMINVTKNL